MKQKINIYQFTTFELFPACYEHGIFPETRRFFLRSKEFLCSSVDDARPMADKEYSPDYIDGSCHLRIIPNGKKILLDVWCTKANGEFLFHF